MRQAPPQSFGQLPQQAGRSAIYNSAQKVVYFALLPAPLGEVPEGRRGQRGICDNPNFAGKTELEFSTTNLKS